MFEKCRPKCLIICVMPLFIHLERSRLDKVELSVLCG
jgi:hypothetical protein